MTKKKAGQLAVISKKNTFVPCVLIKSVKYYWYVFVLGKHPRSAKIKKSKILSFKKSNFPKNTLKSKEFKLALEQYKNDYGKELSVEIEDEMGCYKIDETYPHDEEIDNLYFLSSLYKVHEENPNGVLTQDAKDKLYSIIQQFLIKHFSPEFIVNNRIIDLLKIILIMVNNDKENSNQPIKESLTLLIEKIEKIIES